MNRDCWDSPEYDDKMPVNAKKYFCDVVNCTGKTGTAVLGVLEKQWARLGLSKYDCVAGTGDAGGENEGTSGVHSLLGTCNPSYVRRRCLSLLQ